MTPVVWIKLSNCSNFLNELDNRVIYTTAAVATNKITIGNNIKKKKKKQIPVVG